MTGEIEIEPTSTDVDAIARLVTAEAANIASDYITHFENDLGMSSTDATQRAYDLAYGTIIDSIINRVAADSSEYGTSIQDVIDKHSGGVWQYSSLDSDTPTWSDLPTASTAVNNYVVDHLTARANGEQSSVGASTHYYNPNISSPTWGPDLERPETVGIGSNEHIFGSLPDTDAMPQPYTITYGGHSSTTEIPYPPIPGHNPFYGDSGVPSLPSWIAPVSTAFAAGESASSPLVLDLGTGGINVTALNSSGSVYWDIDNDGFREASGWIAGNSALLAVDRNSDGVINNNSELFGNTATYSNGFANLAQYDSNSDGHISSADTQFANLLVWADDNHDGFSQSGELHTLSSLGITDISLSYSSSSSTINGNAVKQIGTFTMGGVSHAIDDVWFSYDNVNSLYDGTYTLDARTLFLPDLRGYGTLPDLHIAMSNDATLLSMVEDLSAQDVTTLLDPANNLKSELTDILYQWAGVESVNPTSRGAYADAQQLGFLETLLGTPFVWQGTSSNPASGSALFLQQAWNTAFGTLAVHLLGQTAFGEIFGSPIYDPVSGTYSGGTDWTDNAVLQFNTTGYDAVTGTVNNDLYLYHVGDSTASGGDSITETTTGGTDTVLFAGVNPGDVRLWTDTSGNLHIKYSATDQLTLIGGTDIYGANAVYTRVEHIAFDNGTIWDLTQGLHLVDTDDSHNLFGTSLNDILESRGGSNEYTYGYAGNDTLIGGAGSDNLYGGQGNDTYVFAPGDGADAITENASEGTDTIRLTGFSTSDVRLYTDTSGSLHVVSNLNSADNITIYAGITGTGTYESTVGQRVEQIAFDDSTTWSLTGGLPLTGTSSADYLYGTQYDDTIRGLSGNDNLYGNRGNDTITGGAGNDNLTGGTGDDTYVFGAGDGADTITENTSEGADAIRLTGYSTTDVRLYTDTSGSLHVVSNLNSSDNMTIYAGVTGTGFYESKIGLYLEQVVFDDTTTWSLTGGLPLTGSSSADYLYGTQYDDVLKGMAGADNLYGNRGNDTITGGTGNDNLTGGTGNDTYVFSAGDGADTITENTGEGTDTIHLAGFSTSDIRLYTDTSGSLHVVSNLNSSDNITIYAGTTGTGAYESTVGNYVEQITFDDSTTWSLTGGLTLQGTSSTDFLYGTSHDDTVKGMGGNDTLYGNSGNDTLLGGDGNDSLDGGTGTDTLSYADATAGVTVSLAITSGQATGGSGTDTISNFENLTGSAYNDTLTGNSGANVIDGGAGTNSLTGGSGADIFAFDPAVTMNNIQDFSTAQGDKLDISHLIEAYNPTTDAITDFVQITDSGGNSAVSIDADGATGGHSWTQVGTLIGVTGLTDEAALLSAGTLIA